VQGVSNFPTVALVLPGGFLFCDLCVSLFALVFSWLVVATGVIAECILCSDCWRCFLCAHSLVGLIL